MNKVFWPLLYIGSIAFCNWLMLVVPMFAIGSSQIPPVMLVVGFVFIIRDYTQRAIGHSVVPLMLVAALVSYMTSSPAIALASVIAFTASEFVDWLVFTFTKKPLGDRILLSSLFAVPIDTLIFLSMMGILDTVGFLIVFALKMVSAVAIWWYLNSKNTKEEAPLTAVGEHMEWNGLEWVPVSNDIVPILAGGVPAGELNVLMARSGVGKTQLDGTNSYQPNADSGWSRKTVKPSKARPRSSTTTTDSSSDNSLTTTALLYAAVASSSDSSSSSSSSSSYDSGSSYSSYDSSSSSSSSFD